MFNTNLFTLFYILTLFLCLKFSFVNSRKYKYESSYSFLSLLNENNLEEKRFCINYQQWKQKELPSSFEEAPIFNLFWWNKVNNTNICEGYNEFKFPSNSIVPADYITEFNKLRKLCSEQPGFNYSDPNSVRNEVKIMMAASIKNILFLVEKGKKNAYDLHNYLFTHFYNAELNSIKDKSLNVFYVYENNFWKEIEPLLSKTGQLRIYQPKSLFPMDPAVVVLWGFAFISILIGSIWSVLDIKNKLAKYVNTALEDLQLNQNASFTQITEISVNSPTQNERKRSSQSSELANMSVWQHCISVFIALSFVVFILMFAFFFRDYAVNGFNFFLIFLGSIAIKSCVYAILQYLLNGYEYEMFSLRQIFFCFNKRREELNNQQNIPNSSNSLQQQQNSSKKSFLDNPFKLFSTLSFIFSLSICLYWFYIRNTYYAFYLLDFINITICIYAIRFSRIRSLRLITFFLLAFFVYDLFMVFGTRLLTSDGCSVMLQVVTGTDCQPTRLPEGEFQPVAPIDIKTKIPEKLPLLFYVPLLADPMAECFDIQVEREFKNVLLGLGDVILPGKFLFKKIFLKNNFRVFNCLLFLC
uniref:Uncharacterized protein n=2 Tax=Meloidogyne enterolobii TaxID=390850 RepID=A0A6V7VQS0_MELEN|nr:unnamed protein product [Meloidogyne enterolobii]